VRSISLFVILATARVAAAECELSVSYDMFTSRLAVAPKADDSLGADLQVTAPTIGWGRCEGLRHRIGIAAVDAPRYGDPDSTMLHFARYELAWHTPAWNVYVGLRGITRWFDDLRFGTPVLGLRAALSRDVGLELSIESAGVFAFAKAGTSRRLGTDLALEATLVYPARSTVRGELRTRVRDYRRDDMLRIRDVTAAAGVGFAFAARGNLRALPVHVGIAVRRDDQLTAMVVVELALGLRAD
jgi:hypothetical protein